MRLHMRHRIAIALFDLFTRPLHRHEVVELNVARGVEVLFVIARFLVPVAVGRLRLWDGMIEGVGWNTGMEAVVVGEVGGGQGREAV